MAGSGMGAEGVMCWAPEARESVCVQEAGAGPCVRAEMRAKGDKNPAGQQSRLSTRSGEQEGFEHHINDGIQ